MFQLSRLKEIDTTLGHIWEEMRQGYVDEEWDLMQIAVYCQTNINRIVWKLNTILFDPGDEEPPFQEVWIPIEQRPGTDEEYEAFSKFGDCPREDFMIYTNKMPDDGEEVLITTRMGDVRIDTYHNDVDCCYFEDNDDPDDVVAWMPKPIGYGRKVTL